MPKIPVEDISGGMNFNEAAHLIKNNEQRYLSDVSWRNGRWEKRSGYTTPWSATGDTNEILEFGEYERSDGTIYLMAGTTDRIYRLNGTSWTEELNLGTTLDTTEKWFFAEFQGAHYAANGQDNVYIINDPTSDSYSGLSTSPRSITRANIVIGFHQRLLFFNTTDGTDGARPWYVQWSEVNDATDVQNENFLALDNTNSPIISASVFRTNAIVAYKRDAVYLIQDVGDPYYFQSRFSADTGIVAPKARCYHPDGDFFVSDDGFYVFVGNGVLPQEQFKFAFEYFRAEVNEAKMDNVYCYYDRRFSEIHIMYPTDSNDEPNKELVLNVRRQQWVIHTVGGYCGFHRRRSVNTPQNIHGSASGVAKVRNNTTGNGEDDDGTDITTIFRSKAYRRLPTYRVAEDQYAVQDDYADITAVFPNLSPTGDSGATCRIGEADVGDETPDYSTSDTVDDTDGRAPASYPQLSESTGRYLTVEFQDFDWLSSFDYEVAGDGME